MYTLDDDADLDTEFDFSRATQASGPLFPEGFGIRINGATGYSVRLIPSNKVLARADATQALWTTILDAIDRGIPAKCVVLDAHLADGGRYKVSAGRILETIARAGIGTATARSPVRAAS